MTATDQLRADLLDALQRLKLAHHALAEGQHHASLVHIDVAQATLADIRLRLGQPITSQRPPPPTL